jgi:5-methylcytosine-specific restriction endonuclease McrA
MVYLLNSDYTYLNSITWQKSICLLTKGKVQVLKYSDKIIKNYDGSVVMKVPAVLRLIKFIRTLFRTNVPWSKRNVIVRDNHTCAYCGVKTNKLTIDHVIPRSKGGKSTFENCVAACRDCNNKKGNKSCREVNMFLKVKPSQPTISEFLRLKLMNSGINQILKDLGVY